MDFFPLVYAIIFLMRWTKKVEWSIQNRTKKKMETDEKKDRLMFSVYMFLFGFFFVRFSLVLVLRTGFFSWFLSASVNIIYFTPATHSQLLLVQFFKYTERATVTVAILCNTKLFHYNAYIYCHYVYGFGDMGTSRISELE